MIRYKLLAAIFDHQLFEKEAYIRLLHMGVAKAPVCNHDEGLCVGGRISLELINVEIAQA
jgi:hypothetical protein